MTRTLQANVAPLEAAPSRMERFRRWRFRNRDPLLGYAILGPMMIYFFIWTWLPVLFLFVLSVHKWNIIKWPPTFVGFANYVKIFSDPYYIRVLLNTVVMGVAVVLINLVLGFLVALMLNQPIRGRGVFRTIWYIPAILAGAVMAQVMAAFLLPSEGGVVNTILRAVAGAPPVLWGRETFWMPFWVVVFSSWRSIGWTVLFFLAGLQSVDPTLYEAAKIDGANSRQLLRFITIPQMIPIIIFVSVTGLIGGLQMWEAPMVMTGGGPENSTNTIVFSMYRDAFSDLKVGQATAQAAVLLLVLAAGIGFQLYYYRRYHVTD